MGLSSKQVSSDRNGWNQALLQAAGTLELPKPSSTTTKKQPSSQPQQQQPEQLNCPRCDSSNTKFCYYNNYNKSQPRHFCKACKRHWTKGGTLRNVPVGGGRKNKRLKASSNTSKFASKTNPPATTTTTNTNTSTSTTTYGGLGNHSMTLQQRVSLPLGLGALNGIVDDHKTFYENFLEQTSTSMVPEGSMMFSSKCLNERNNDFFLGSTLSLSHQNHDQDHVQFQYSNLGSFESNPSSISSTITSIPSPNIYYGGDQANGLEENVMDNSVSEHHQQPWTTLHATTTTTTSSNNNVMDMSSNWGWDDFDKFVSVDADLTMPWDDTDVKP